jgi:ubiquinol-cytochrome c reductase cytochrome c subunit
MPVRMRALAIFAAVLLAALVGGFAARASAQSPPPDKIGNPATGRDLYLQDCAVCHGPEGKGSYLGPRIDTKGAAGVDLMVRSGRMPLPDPRTRGHQERPSYSEPEILALVAYARTVFHGPDVPDVRWKDADVAKGGELFRLSCAPCHQVAGQGGTLAWGTTVPALMHSSPTEVVEAMRVGPTTMPVFGRETIDDHEAAAIARYVVELQHPDDRGGLGLWHIGPVTEGLAAWVVGMGGLFLLIRWLGTRDEVSTG